MIQPPKAASLQKNWAPKDEDLVPKDPGSPNVR